MSVAELQKSFLALPQKERHEFFRWVLSQERDYGDVDPEVIVELMSDVWSEEENADASKP